MKMCFFSPLLYPNPIYPLPFLSLFSSSPRTCSLCSSSHSPLPFILNPSFISPLSLRHCIGPGPGVGHRHGSSRRLHPPRHPHPLPPDHWQVRALLCSPFKHMQRGCHSVSTCHSTPLSALAALEKKSVMQNCFSPKD